MIDYVSYLLSEKSYFFFITIVLLVTLNVYNKRCMTANSKSHFELFCYCV